MTERRAWLPAAVILALAYCSTLAPSVTFWDAGEFIAAAHSLGIPHPPGTPLYILALNVWARPWADEFYALGTNLFSAAMTVAAAALSAVLVFRWVRKALGDSAAFAAATASATCAGAMYTAWSNATETEVYAASLALAIATMAAAERRRPLLVAYCFGLAAALHVSALVAAPAAIVLASTREDDGFNLHSALPLAAALLAAMAIGTWNGVLGLLAAATALVAMCHPERSEGSALQTVQGRFRAALRMTALVILGASPLLFMLVRARFDPAINQGNPETLSAFADVIARRQYELPGLWPRRAPLWIQLGNWFEYADWQTALSLGPGVVPTIQRTLVSIFFAGVAVFGAATHRRLDRRSWRASLMLFIAGTAGVALYLNLRASPSFGWGVLPEGALREARERDYFFVLGFWAAGIWIGIGAIAMAMRWRAPLLAGVAVAGLPIALNWSAVSRRTEPDAVLPVLLARAIVAGLPHRSVLFVAGDNDTYPVWFRRQVIGERRDVTIVTIPLIGAPWYVAELIRRNPDLAAARTSEGTNAGTIADAARAAGLPVAAAFTLEKTQRNQLNGCWRVIGLAMIDVLDGSNCLYENREGFAGGIPVDTHAIHRHLETIPAIPPVKRSLDPVAEHFAKVLNCPRILVENARKKVPLISLDSTCNL